MTKAGSSRFLLFLGGAALVAGAALAFSPYDGRASTAGLGDRPVTASLVAEMAHGSMPARCERPITGIAGDPPDSLTFGKAQGRVFIDRTPVACPSSARWRLAGAVALVVVGAVALAVWFRRSRLTIFPDDDGPQEPGEPGEHASPRPDIRPE